MVIPATTAEFRQLSLVWKTELVDSMFTWLSSETAVEDPTKIQWKRALLSGSEYNCQETSKESSHEMRKPCLNFSLALSDDVNNDDTVVTIIINHGFYAHVD